MLKHFSIHSCSPPSLEGVSKQSSKMIHSSAGAAVA
jgi:hypothetical protein